MCMMLLFTYIQVTCIKGINTYTAGHNEPDYVKRASSLYNIIGIKPHNSAISKSLDKSSWFRGRSEIS